MIYTLVKKMYEYFFQEIKNEVKVHKRESDKEMIDYYDTHNMRRWFKLSLFSTASGY